jgi:hypothetical protein
MIHTYFHDSTGIGDDYYSLNLHCYVARATGEFQRKWEYYNSIFGYEVSEEERILDYYQMCVLYENEEDLFGFINYGNRVVFRYELARKSFCDMMSFLPKDRRRAVSSSRRIQSMIKLHYRQLEVHPEYGCFIFTECGSIGFAERLKWIAKNLCLSGGECR